MLKYLLNSFFIFFIPVFSFAQEGLKPLSANINYLYGDLKVKPGKQITPPHFQNKSASGSLLIPFVEDFYYSQSVAYPIQSLWSDSSTYISSGFGRAPLSIGVATFDGLNKFGYPYTPTSLSDQTIPNPADTLTSQPIDLSAYTIADSLALIFYYQARGNGEAPELSDSLIVDFYNVDSLRWDTAWFARGNSSPNINDTMFKRAFIRLDSSYYFHDGFKFRFRNKATTSGDFDHWNIDYVYLAQNLHVFSDTTFADFSIGYIPTPLLKNYSAMPWRQYDTSEMARHNSVFIRNNGVDPNSNSLAYSNKIYDKNDININSYSGGGYSDLGLFKYHGWLNKPSISNPAYSGTTATSYYFPPMTGPEYYKIKHYITNLNTDFIPYNDTVVQHQDFTNYYAFDDGTAEAGYYVNATGARIACKYTLRVADTLRAIRIYFEPAGSLNTDTNYHFQVTIWYPGTNKPSNNVLYRDSSKSVRYPYNAGYNTFSEYPLTHTVILNPGTYYIGFQQKPVDGIPVGYDVNTDHSQSLFYDSGAGWTQSQIYGSLMFRPVFGSYDPVGIKENSKPENNLFSVYPNPASNQFIIQSKEFDKASYMLINSLGQTVGEEKTESGRHFVNTENLSSGIYFLILKVKGQPAQQNKIIIQH